MNVVAAKDVSVLVRVGDIDLAVGCATAVTFTYKNEIIGKTDVNAGLFRKKRVRISDMSATVTGLISLVNTTKVSAFYFLQEAVRRTEQYLIFVFTDESGLIRTIAANFLVESETLSGGAASDFAEYNLNLEGTGDLTISDIESHTDSDCFEAFSDWWSTTPGGISISGAGHDGKSFAGQEIIEVVREAGPPLSFTAGTPGDREYGFDGTTITTWASNPYSSGERIFVIWQAVV